VFHKVLNLFIFIPAFLLGGCGWSNPRGLNASRYSQVLQWAAWT